MVVIHFIQLLCTSQAIPISFKNMLMVEEVNFGDSGHRGRSCWAVFEQMRWMREHNCEADLCYFTKSKGNQRGLSLMVQWLDSELPVQGHRVLSWLRNYNPTCYLVKKIFLIKKEKNPAKPQNPKHFFPHLFLLVGG